MPLSFRLALVSVVEGHRLDRSDVDAAEFDRIAERESADRFVEMDPVEHIVAMPGRRQPDEKECGGHR
jgi:hypothetical protein